MAPQVCGKLKSHGWLVRRGKKPLWDPTPDIFAKKIACRTNSRQTTFFLVLRFLFFNFFMFRHKKIPAVISGTNHHLRNLDLDLFCQTLRPWLLFGWKKRSCVLRKHSSTLPGFLSSLKTPVPLLSLKIRNFSIMSYFFLPPVETQSNSFTLTACSQQKEKKGPRKERDRDRKDHFLLCSQRKREKGGTWMADCFGSLGSSGMVSSLEGLEVINCINTH